MMDKAEASAAPRASHTRLTETIKPPLASPRHHRHKHTSGRILLGFLFKFMVFECMKPHWMEPVFQWELSYAGARGK